MGWSCPIQQKVINQRLFSIKTSVICMFDHTVPQLQRMIHHVRIYGIAKIGKLFDKYNIFSMFMLCNRNEFGKKEDSVIVLAWKSFIFVGNKRRI